MADLVGISVRTLHHYDEIGLLRPEKTTEAGYRLYSDENLERLQQILFFRELGFPLKEIKKIINEASFDRLEALKLQRKMLLEKQKQLDSMVKTIDKTIKYLRGEIKMTNKEKFTGFDFNKNPYEKEARERWGSEAVNKSKAKMANLTSEKENEINERMNEIYFKLAEFREGDPQSTESQQAIKEWFDFLNSNFGHQYSLDAFKGLGQMYVADERFTENIDKFGEGLAQFMCDAMAYFADSRTGDK